MTAIERFALGLLIVVALIGAWALAQGIGETIGHGMREWMVVR